MLSSPLEELLEGQTRGVATLSGYDRIQHTQRLHLLLHHIRVEGARLVLQIGAYAAHEMHAEISVLGEHFQQRQAGETEIGRHGA